MRDVYYRSLVYGLLAPAVVDKRWKDVPEQLKILGKAHRMAKSLECVQNEIATEFDALIFLYTASLCVPFNTTWVNIYMYLFRKYLPSFADAAKLPVVNLDAFEKSELEKLRKWIFKQQVKKLRKEKRW